MQSRDQSEIQVMQTHHSREIVVLPPFVCAVLSFCIYMFKGMELDRSSSLMLITIYLAYIAFSVVIFSQDRD